MAGPVTMATSLLLLALCITPAGKTSDPILGLLFGTAVPRAWLGWHSKRGGPSSLGLQGNGEKGGSPVAGLEVFNAGWVYAKSLQSCPTLCDPMDFSLPGPFVHGILQARILEWGCRAFLQGTFPTQRSNLCLLRLLRCRRTLFLVQGMGPYWSSESRAGWQRPRLCGLKRPSCLLDSVILPSSCCITFISKKIPESRVISYQLTNGSVCPQAGVM